ncbi:MAG: phosphoglycerate kinase [Candidatus Margulisiibacteriota bacterium]|jgi:phosphoglycerate kinase
MNKRSITDLKAEELKGKKILVRVDFNVPLDEQRKITDDLRIRAALPTIKYLVDAGAKLILCSHLGQPKTEEEKAGLSLAPVAKRLSELTGQNVLMVSDCIGEVVKQAVAKMNNGDIILLENVRFYKGETKNDPEFAKQLAENAELYVNDAFGTAHRAHASTEGVTKFLPGVAGFLIQKELEFLGSALNRPKRPLMAIIGGAKVSSKIGVLRHLLQKVDTLFVGGGMAYTVLKALGYEVGKSLLEPDFVNEAKAIMAEAKAQNKELILPTDVIIADSFSNEAKTRVAKIDAIPADWEGLDIGPETIKAWSAKVQTAATVLWNGPVGAFEMPTFCKGTEAIARALAETKAVTIIGGGDSVAAINKFGLADKVTHISTGGGASLEFLEGKVLPGIAALKDK